MSGGRGVLKGQTGERAGAQMDITHTKKILTETMRERER